MSVLRTDARGRKDLVELMSVEEVEAVIEALGDKVARLQKDIATLKHTRRFNHSLDNADDGSHRSTTTDMPTELTTRKVLRKRISRGIQYDTQDCQQTNYRVSVKCFQRKNSKINDSPIKHRQNHRSNNGSKAQINEARSIDNKQRDKRVIWNMDEQTGTASRREIDDEESRANQIDAGRYAAAVDERNRPPVVKTITTPHTNSNEAYTIGSNASNKHLDRTDRKELDTGVFKSNHGKFDKDDSRVVGKKDKKVKEKRIFGGKSSADGKLNKRKNDDDDAALKARPILNEKNKADDLVVDDNTVKPLKMSEKEKVNRIASKIKKLYKIKARKNIPDETKLSSAADGMNNSRKSVVKNKKSVSLENNYFEGAQEMKNNSKSGDSMEHPYVSMKKKLNKCTKEIDQFVGKVTNLFQKKSSKSK